MNEMFEEERMTFADLVAEMGDRDLAKEPYSFRGVMERLEIIGIELEANGGEVTPEIDEMMDRLFENRREKAKATMLFCRSKKKQIEALKAEAQKFAAMAKSRAAWISKLESLILFDMRHRGEKVLDTDLFTIKRVRAGKPSVGLAEGVEVEKLDPQFQRVIPKKYELDKMALYKFLKSSEPDFPTEAGEFEYGDFTVTVKERLSVV